MEDEELEYKKYISKLVVIRNSISLICFTILAMVFNNFWLVLVALLFTSYVKDETEE